MSDVMFKVLFVAEAPILERGSSVFTLRILVVDVEIFVDIEKHGGFSIAGA